MVRHPIRLKLLIERFYLRVQGFDSLLLRPLRRKIEMEELSQLLEKAWAEPEPMSRVVSDERREQEEKKILFLGKKEIPVRSNSIVVFSNEEFFIELVSGSFVIRPRYEKEYLRIKGKRGNKRYTKFTKAPTPIVVPLAVTRENPEIWFNEQYVRYARKNMQGSFIKRIWEYREEFMGLLCVG